MIIYLIDSLFKLPFRFLNDKTTYPSVGECGMKSTNHTFWHPYYNHMANFNLNFGEFYFRRIVFYKKDFGGDMRFFRFYGTTSYGETISIDSPYLKYTGKQY